MTPSSLRCSGLLVLAAPLLARATVFATIQGVVHDPQHRPIAGAQITLRPLTPPSPCTPSPTRNGEFDLAQVPIGVYTLDQSPLTGFTVLNATDHRRFRHQSLSSTFRSPSAVSTQSVTVKPTPDPFRLQTPSLPPPSSPAR